MLSTPPATKSWPSPARIAWAARITALRLAPQTLLTVIAPTLVRQSAIDGALASDVLAQAGRHHIAHDDLVDGRQVRQLARCTAARTTAAPRALAGTRLRVPRSRPTGVRAALKMTAVVDSLALMATTLSLRSLQSRLTGLPCEARGVQVNGALKMERCRRLRPAQQVSMGQRSSLHSARAPAHPQSWKHALEPTTAPQPSGVGSRPSVTLPIYSNASFGENGCMNGPARTSRYRRDRGCRLR